jgi:DNA-binding MarR family transcriptional regulator
VTGSGPANAKDLMVAADDKIDKPQLRLDRFLPHRLSVLSNTVSRQISREYAERFGLSIPEWRVIAVLQYFPGISSGELAKESGMDNVAVSRAVEFLVRGGLITRHSSASDRRRTVLDLTAKGQRVYDEITPLALASESLLSQELTLTERNQLDSILTKLLTQAKRLGTDS